MHSRMLFSSRNLSILFDISTVSEEAENLYLKSYGTVTVVTSPSISGKLTCMVLVRF